MNKPFKGLLALASLAIVSLGSFFVASPAMAYTPVAPCVKYPATPTATWPGNGSFFNCTGNPSDAVMVQIYNKAVQNTNTYPNLRTILNNGSIKIFVFPNVSNYNAYPHFSGNPVGTPPNGGTILASTKPSQGGGLNAPVTAIFTVPNGNTLAQRTLNHEMGHQLDLLTGNEGSTANSIWQGFLLQDFIDLDALGPKNFPGFTATCNAYPKNSDRLLCMHNNKTPYFLPVETFAEEFASLMSGGGNFLEAGSVMTNYFRTGGGLQNPPRNPRSRDYIRSKF